MKTLFDAIGFAIGIAGITASLVFFHVVTN